jgi:MFS family permease
VVAYYATRDLVPLYAVYSLLFRDAGLSTGQISSLLVLWSLTSFVLEVPSGAWADTIDRRTLLVVSAGVYACAFASWMLFASYPGFALGFMLWGASSSLMSGTFEALVYDELSAAGRTAAYARLIGWSESAALIANLAATAAAAPLFAWGGYPLVGWASVGLAIVHGCLAAGLPKARAVGSADETLDAEAESTVVRRYVSMLRDGVAEVGRRPVIRRLVILLAAVYGLTAYDEYFPLLMGDAGIITGTVPVVLAVIVAAQAIGTALAGRTEALGSATLAAALGVAVALVTMGTLAGSLAGFAAIAVGYGAMHNVIIVTGARLQHAIEGSARATVTSVSGLTTEVFALAVYGFVGLGSQWWSLPVVVALLGAPAMATAVMTRAWLPSGTPTRR